MKAISEQENGYRVVKDMKTIFYILCPIPAICLLISWNTPNNFNAGGPSVMLQFELLAAILVSSPVLTFVGLLGAIADFSNRKNLLWPCITTAIAAFPGIYFLVGMLTSKN